MSEEITENKTKSKSGKGKTTVIIIAILAVTALAVILVLSVGKKKKGNGMPAGFGGFGGGRQSVTAVRTVVAKNTILTDYVMTNGEIETQKSIEVFPSIGGRVIEVRVSLGSQVKAGDVIAYIDPSEPGAVYAKSPVVAPIDGSILTSPVKVGQKVSASQIITKIGDINNLQVTAKVPERYVSELSIGQKAEITLQAYGDEIFMASIVRISPVVDPATRTKEIILNFDKHDDKVNAGMFANVKLYTVDYSGYPAIQQDAFEENNDEYYIYIVKEDSTVTKRKVKRGKNVSDYCQVIEGLENGEAVVIEGMLSLYEGAKVRDISGNVAFVEPQAPEGKDGAPEGFPGGKK